MVWSRRSPVFVSCDVSPIRWIQSPEPFRLDLSFGFLRQDRVLLQRRFFQIIPGWLHLSCRRRDNGLMLHNFWINVLLAGKTILFVFMDSWSNLAVLTSCLGDEHVLSSDDWLGQMRPFPILVLLLRQGLQTVAFIRPNVRLWLRDRNYLVTWAFYL